MASKVSYGKKHYSWHQPDLSTVINKLYSYYRLEGITMAYTMDDYRRETAQEVLSTLTPKQRIDGLSAKELLSALTPSQLKALRESGLLSDG